MKDSGQGQCNLWTCSQLERESSDKAMLLRSLSRDAGLDDELPKHAFSSRSGEFGHRAYFLAFSSVVDPCGDVDGLFTSELCRLCFFRINFPDVSFDLGEFFVCFRLRPTVFGPVRMSSEEFWLLCVCSIWIWNLSLCRRRTVVEWKDASLSSRCVPTRFGGVG